MRGDWVAIVPAKTDVKETARALLALARTPADVRTDSNGDVFQVPPYLADLYTTPAPAPKRRRAKPADAPSDQEEGEE